MVALVARASNLARNVLAGVLGTLIILAVVEGGVRLYAALDGAPAFSRQSALDPMTEREPLLEFRLRPGFAREHIAINSRGLRGPEFDAKPRDGTIRVIALGDSCTFGTYTWGSAHHPDPPRRGRAFTTHEIAASYPAMLEARLNAGAARARFEVLNAGVPGYSSRQALVWLESEILSFRPDVVVVYLGWNDLNDAISPRWNEGWVRYGGWRRTAVETSWGRLAYRIAQSSAIVRAMYLAQFAVRNRRGVGTAEIVAGHSRGLALKASGAAAVGWLRSNLSLIVQHTRARGAAVVLVTLPTVVTPRLDADTIRAFDALSRWEDRATMWETLQAANRAIAEVARAEGVTVVDLATIFVAKDTTSLFSDDNHPNAAGAAIVAAEVARAVQRLRGATGG